MRQGRGRTGVGPGDLAIVPGFPKRCLVQSILVNTGDNEICESRVVCPLDLHVQHLRQRLEVLLLGPTEVRTRLGVVENLVRFAAGVGVAHRCQAHAPLLGGRQPANQRHIILLDRHANHRGVRGQGHTGIHVIGVVHVVQPVVRRVRHVDLHAAQRITRSRALRKHPANCELSEAKQLEPLPGRLLLAGVQDQPAVTPIRKVSQGCLVHVGLAWPGRRGRHQPQRGLRHHRGHLGGNPLAVRGGVQALGCTYPEIEPVSVPVIRLGAVLRVPGRGRVFRVVPDKGNLPLICGGQLPRQANVGQHLPVHGVAQEGGGRGHQDHRHPHLQGAPAQPEQPAGAGSAQPAHDTGAFCFGLGTR
mmetsp:Transcript_83257/g.222574  ORF Transcript_83257/g.222574 Transcript_83257/m.222574 type:complete len:360 (-) Transcript_83257:8-1087(-)